MRFAKGHGTENDFVILLDPDGSGGLTAGLAARLCDRRAGIGGDGVLRAVRAAVAGVDGPGADGPGAGGPGAGGPGAGGPWGDGPGEDGAGGAAVPEWFMDYRNADGSLAEMCGNGIRVFARYLVRHGLADGPEFTVATRSGPRRVRIGADGDVTVDMGPVAVLGPGSAVVAGRTYQGLRVSVGNPHLACLVEDPLAGLDLSGAPQLDPGQFPGGANVELVQRTGPRSVTMRVHERGSGETRSCGTGAVAAAAAVAAAGAAAGGTATGAMAAGAMAAGGTAAGGTAVGGTAGAAAGPGVVGNGTWDVRVPGGDLTVTLEAGNAWLTGPAVIVAEGELDPSWLAAGHLAGTGTAVITDDYPAGDARNRP